MMKVFYFPNREERAVELDIASLPPGIREFIENATADAVDEFNNSWRTAREVVIQQGGKVSVTTGLGYGGIKEQYSMRRSMA